jgi:hypothetical protein
MSNEDWRLEKLGLEDGDEHTDIPSSNRDVSYPAILTHHDNKYFAQWTESNQAVKLRVAFLKCPNYISMFALRFRFVWTDVHDKKQEEHADLFVTTGQTKVNEIDIQPVTAEYKAGSDTVPAFLKQSDTKMDDRIKDNLIWRLRIPYKAESPHACNFFVTHTESFVKDQISPLIDLVTRDGLLELWLRGTEADTSVEELVSLMHNEQLDPPLDRWYLGVNQRKMVKGQYQQPQNRPLLQARRRFTFSQKLDYMTTLGFAAVQEQEFVTGLLEQLPDAGAYVRLLSIPGAGDRRYFGFLEVPNLSELRLQPGDKMTICFDTETDIREQDWYATVIDPMPYAPLSTTSLLVTRKWDSELGEWLSDPWDNACFSPVSIDTMAEGSELRAALINAQSAYVTVRVAASDKPFSRQLVSIQQLCEEGSRVRWQLLLANNLAALPPVNLYATIEEDLSGFPATHNLNGMQLIAWQELRGMVGGVSLVQGPPGTGKSFWLYRAVLPFVMHKQRGLSVRHQVMITAPSNQVVNDLAAGMAGLLKQSALDRDAFVVRVHSIDTERTITFNDAVREGQEATPPVNQRPAIIQQSDMPDALDTFLAAYAVKHAHDRCTAQRVPGVADPRVVELSLSVGMRMLEFAGIIMSPLTRSRSKYQPFRVNWERIRHGEEMTSEDWTAARAQAKEIMEDVLKAADIVVATLSLAGEAFMKLNFQPSVIAVDEAAKASEPELWNIFAGYNECPVILVGDDRQLSPTVMSSASTNSFAPQLQLSLFDRLVQAGFPSTMLTDQHRMIPALSSLVSESFYGGQLRDAAPRAGFQHDLTKKLVGFNAQEHQVKSAVVWLNNGYGASEQIGGTRSTENVSNVALVMDLIVRLVGSHTATLGELLILVPYQAQFARYNQARTILGEQHRDWDVSLLQVKTIDSFQGAEHAITIVDLTVSERLGFLREATRLNVACSRAQHGTFFVGNIKGIEKEKGNKRKFVQKVIDFCKKKKWIFNLREAPAIPDWMFTRSTGPPLVEEEDDDDAATEPLTGESAEPPLPSEDNPVPLPSVSTSEPPLSPAPVPVTAPLPSENDPVPLPSASTSEPPLSSMPVPVTAPLPGKNDPVPLPSASISEPAEPSTSQSMEPPLSDTEITDAQLMISQPIGLTKSLNDDSFATW